MICTVPPATQILDLFAISFSFVPARRTRLLGAIVATLVVAIGVVLLLRGRGRVPPEAARATTAASPVKTSIPFDEAAPVLERLRTRLPPDLTSKTPADLAAVWPDWVSRHDADVRARL